MGPLSVGAQVLDELRSSAAPETRLSDGSTARRVGRNPVWHLETSDGQNCFVKLCGNDDNFARQVFGWRVSQEMAAADARFMAAEVVTADPIARVLVTRPIGGAMVSTHFARAFRRDRNPLGRVPARAGAREALRMVATWLDALHARAADSTVPLYDLSRAATWHRAARKLDVLATAHPVLADYVGFSARWRFVAPPGDEALVFGDATMANFFVDGGRVGAVDFEDIGRGPVARDWATLQDDVLRAFGNLHYRSDRDVLEQVACPPDVSRGVVLLELAVNRLEQALQLDGLTAAFGRRTLRARVARLVGELAAAGAIEGRAL